MLTLTSSPHNNNLNPFEFIDSIWQCSAYYGGFPVVILLDFIHYNLLGGHPKNPKMEEFWTNSPIDGFTVKGVTFKYSPNLGILDDPEVVNGDFILKLRGSL